MKTVNVDGEFVKLKNVRLLKKPISIPIYIGATGVNMFELAGEIADGVLMNYLVSPEYIRKALAFLSRGAAKAGRKLEDLDRPQLVACFMDEDVDKAMNTARLMILEYLFTQPHIMKACGVKPDVLSNIHETLGSWPPEPGKVDRMDEALAGRRRPCKKCLRSWNSNGLQTKSARVCGCRLHMSLNLPSHRSRGKHDRSILKWLLGNHRYSH